MSNGLNLPFAGTLATDEQVVFSVTNPADPPRPTTLHPVITAVEGKAITGVGVSGTSQKGVGVSASSDSGIGIEAVSNSGEGVFGQGRNGVHGRSASPTDSGVWGENTGSGYGVSGETNSTFQPGPNVVAAVWGMNHGSGAGVKGMSVGGDGVVGFSGAKDHAGVSAVGNGIGLWAGGTPAGHFEGDIKVTGKITLGNQDCAEDFDIECADEIEPGTVMVITPGGALQASEHAYDNRVAGVVAGAGSLRPGIILGRQEGVNTRLPISLVGRVHCKVDAGSCPIEVGDLLTSSDTPGHAMKAVDRAKAFGSVLGKALAPLRSRQGLIPILVALQ
jgi:hypothetical protein